MDRSQDEKLSEFEGIIRPIDIVNDAQNLADFFNEIDELWPGTWTRGIPYTKQLAIDFINKRKSLKNFVAFNPDGKLVGFCSVHKRMEEPNVSYIGVLGAHPSILSKKYGKNLLLAAVDFSVKNGDLRQDLNTWASNMKAVPLYKKIGLQWVPDTSVYMQNYLPAILNHSFCKPFFEKHPNWYSNQVREITQAPDDHKLADMSVFKYYFKEGEDSLEVTIDRFSRSIVGISRNLEGKLIQVILRQNTHEVFTGIETNFHLGVNHNLGKALPLSINFEPSKEISIHKMTANTEALPEGLIYSNYYLVNSTTPDSNVYRKTPSLKAHLNVNGELFTLEMGVRAKQLINITSHHLDWWYPTGIIDLPLVIQNRTHEPIQGEIRIWSNANIEIIEKISPITLSSEEVIGKKFQIKVPKSFSESSITLYAQLVINNNKSRIFEIPLFVSNDPSVAAGLLSDSKKIILLNQFIRTEINLEGARVTILSKDYSLMGIGVNLLDFGPPFGFSEFNQVEFSSKISKNEDGIVVRLSKASLSKPELKFNRLFKLSPQNHHIEVWEEIENHGSIDDSLSVLIQPHFTNGVSLPIGETYLALDGEILHEKNVIWPIREGDLPDESERFEPWICIDVAGVSYYHIHDPINTSADPSRNKLNYLEKTLNIPALTVVKGPKSWLGISNQYKWKDIRQKARFLTQGKLLSVRENNQKAKAALNLLIPQEDLLLGNSENRINLTIESYRNMPLNGKLTVKSPDGWSIDIDNDQIENLCFQNSHQCKLTVKLPDSIYFGIYPLTVLIQSPFNNIMKRFLVLAFQATSQPRIEILPQHQGKKQVLLRNESLSITSSEDFAGAMTSLKWNDIEYLCSNFPMLIPSVFFNKDPGGVYNSLLGENDELDELKYIDEKYVYEETHDGPWKGVQYTVNINEQKSLKGLVLKISYEMLGGNSRILRIRIRIDNPTTAAFRFIHIGFLFPGFEGKRDEMYSMLDFDDPSQIYEFSRKNPIPLIGLGSSSIKSLFYHKNGHSLSLIPDVEKSNVLIFDAGEMVSAGGVFSSCYLEPNQSNEIIYYLVPNLPSENNARDVQELFSH
ncbi:GNAT family N-acetyltransferase [Candidatus Hodarchaeum mangrovi]